MIREGMDEILSHVSMGCSRQRLLHVGIILKPGGHALYSKLLSISEALWVAGRPAAGQNCLYW